MNKIDGKKKKKKKRNDDHSTFTIDWWPQSELVKNGIRRERKDWCLRCCFAYTNNDQLQSHAHYYTYYTDENEYNRETTSFICHHLSLLHQCQNLMIDC